MSDLGGTAAVVSTTTANLSRTTGLSGVAASGSTATNGGTVGLLTSGSPELILIVYNEDGQVDLSEFACSDDFSCGGKSNGGPDAAGWKMPFPAYAIPDDYARVSIFDGASGVEFWRGRFCPWSLPDWDGCSTTLDANVEGDTARLSDESFGAAVDVGDLGAAQTVVYGPQRVIPTRAGDPGYPTPRLIGSVVALTPEAAIQHAISQLCPDISLIPSLIATTGVAILERKGFPLGKALNVINYMTGLFDYLATPFVWHVRPTNGVSAFSWQPMESAAKYRVDLAEGAKLTIVRNPSAVANRAVVGFGGHDQATSSPAPPSAIDYSEIPIIRDVTINLTGQIETLENAQQAADGMLARGRSLKLGWQYRLTIPRGCPVYDISDGLPGTIIKPWLIQEGHVIQVDGIHAEHPSWRSHVPPETHFITSWKWSGNGVLSLECGETRKQEAINQMRSVAGGSDLFNPQAKIDPRYSHPNTDMSQVVMLGTKDLSASDSSGYPPDAGPKVPMFVPGVPSLGTIGPATNDDALLQMIPQQQAQHPPIGTVNIQAADIAEGGLVMGAVLSVGPMTIISWEIQTNVPVTFEVQFAQASTGAVVLTVSMDSGSATATAWGGYTTETQTLDPTVDLTESDDQLIPTVTVTDGSVDLLAAAITIHFAPLFPGFPDLEIDDQGVLAVAQWDGYGRGIR